MAGLDDLYIDEQNDKTNELIALYEDNEKLINYFDSIDNAIEKVIQSKDTDRVNKTINQLSNKLNKLSSLKFEIYDFDVEIPETYKNKWDKNIFYITNELTISEVDAFLNKTIQLKNKIHNEIVRIEQERKKKEEKEKKRQRKLEEERKRKEEAERKQKLEEERKRKEEIERKRKLEEERKRKEEAERKRKLEEERKRKEELERKRKLEEERKRKEEAERKQKLEEERERKEELERKRKLKEEKNRKKEVERKRKLAEEKKRKEEAERKRKLDEKSRIQDEKRSKIRGFRVFGNFLIFLGLFTIILFFSDGYLIQLIIGGIELLIGWGIKANNKID